MNSDVVEERIAITEVGIPMAEAKAKLSSIIGGLNERGDVIINVHNRPRAAIVDINSYLDMKAKARAYELLQLAQDAENAPKLSYEQIEERIMQNRAVRAARARGAAEAAR